jgi:APA family basic amino acid/polyamine antiporter
LAAIPVLAGLFIGVEFSAEVGEEVRDGRRLIARGIGLSVAIVVTIYAAVSTVTVGILGAPALSASKAPLLEAGNHFLGHYGYLAITCAALLAIATSLNGVILIFSRFLFAMGRAGALPAVLGRAHPKWGTPHVAMTLVLVLSTVGLLLPDELLFLFLAVNLPSLFKYMANCVAAMFLVRNHPELYEAAAFRPRRTLIIAVAVTGITCAALMVLAGMSSDWRPYAILAGWAAVGATYWRLRRRNRVMAAFPDNSTAAP